MGVDGGVWRNLLDLPRVLKWSIKFSGLPPHATHCHPSLGRSRIAWLGGVDGRRGFRRLLSGPRW